MPSVVSSARSDGPTLQAMTSAAVAALVDNRFTVATAESLTGGLVSAHLTSVPGSSAAVRGGVVAYATDVKQRLLGVPEEIVAEHGVVSGACAAALAVGARELLGATFGVSTTGVAGPDSQEGKPVGTVYIAVAGPTGEPMVTPLMLSGDREAIRVATVAEALRVIIDAVLSAVG